MICKSPKYVQRLPWSAEVRAQVQVTCSDAKRQKLVRKLVMQHARYGGVHGCSAPQCEGSAVAALAGEDSHVTASKIACAKVGGWTLQQCFSAKP